MSLSKLLGQFCGMAAVVVFAGVAHAQCTSTSGTYTCTSSDGPITLNDETNSNPFQPNSPVAKASPYPSIITIPTTGAGSVPGAVATIQVRLNGLNADISKGFGIGGTSILLVSPSGKNLAIMGFPGAGSVGFQNVTFNITDSAAQKMPATNSDFPANSSFEVTGTISYKPTTNQLNGASPTFPNPAPAIQNYPGPYGGSSTLNGVFDGDTAAGAWKLYISDDGQDSISIASWSLVITPATGTSTSLTLNAPSPTTAFTAAPNNSVSLSATVTPSAATGTVAFFDTLPGGSATAIAGCTSVAPSGGTASCSHTFSTEGIHSISAQFTGTGSYASSPVSNSANVFIKGHSTLSGSQYCNPGSITAQPNPTATTPVTTPYPSIINVGTDTTGIPSDAVSSVSVVLNNLSASSPENLHLLLVGPDGAGLLFLSGAGGTSSTSGTYTFSDSGNLVPVNGPFASNNAPTAYNLVNFTFPAATSPAPAIPATYSLPETEGGNNSKDFTTTFNGAASNGDWKLYVYNTDGSAANPATIGKWCINLIGATGTRTVTSVSGSPNGPQPNGAVVGGPVAITARVTANGTPVAEGSVTFSDNGQNLGTVPVGTSGPTTGQATYTTSTLKEGDHTITAIYNDSGSTYSTSDAMYVQRVDTATSPVTVLNGVFSYCNAGKITIPDPNDPNLNVGQAAPNPSVISVRNLPGTIKDVSVSLNGYHVPAQQYIESLLVGPAQNTGSAIDFFSDAGPRTAYPANGSVNLTFSDNAASLFPATSTPSGTSFKPTSYANLPSTPDTFVASSSGFYTLPSTFRYASSAGSSTFDGVFASGNGNGNWGLYLYQNIAEAGGGIDNGWCLNFTENTPVLSLTDTSSGPGKNGDFVQGQQGTYTITVINNGPGPTGGAVTVTDTLPSGMTVASLSGSGWTCTTGTLTCTSSSDVVAGSSYPVISLVVNVASNASSPETNTVKVSGGGDVTTGGHTVSTPTTIDSAAVLSLTNVAVGTFTQGGTGEWDLTVSDSSANSQTIGTVTLVDTLPTGYTVSSETGSGWSCGASGTTTITVTCTTSNVASPGTPLPTLKLMVNIPANSPTSVTNTASASGGGAASGTGNVQSTVTVVQVPATVAITAGNNQTTTTNSAFSNALQVTVTDAGNVAVANQSVMFTVHAGSGGASAAFGGASSSTVTTNASGVATTSTLTANGTAGSFSVTATAGSVSNTFSLTVASGTVNVSSSVSVTSSGMAYNPIKHIGTETFTITNTGTQPISGPLELVLTLSQGVTASNNTGVQGGNPYWNVPGVASLAPGSSATVTVQLAYSAGTSVSTSSTVYSGSF